MKNDEKEKKSNSIWKVLNGFVYAGRGICSAFKSEINMKIHIICMILVIVFGIWLELSAVEWLICIVLFAGVIAGEMFNTAIENVVDMITLEHNEKARVAKDVAAGAVLVWATCAAVIGGVIFIKHLGRFYLLKFLIKKVEFCRFLYFEYVL